jgi:hypothetical protein
MSLHTVDPVATRLDSADKVIKSTLVAIEALQELLPSRLETTGLSSISGGQ